MNNAAVPVQSFATRLLIEAWQCYHAADLSRAEVLCRQALAAQPGHAEALHLLGLIFCQAGQTEKFRG